MRVLITGAQGPAGSALVRQLLARGHEVVACDMLPGQVSGLDVVVVPPADDPGMVPTLARLAHAHAVDLVIPTVSEELSVMAASVDAFGCRVLVSPSQTVQVAADKLTTMWFLERRGLPVPRFCVPSDVADADAALALLGAPLIVKPRVSRGGRGVVVVDDASAWPAPDDSQILQEFAPGHEWAPVVWLEDEEATVVVLRKTELKEGRVGNAVSVVRDESEQAQAVGRIAVDVARALGVVGPVDMDVRLLADGRPVVLEVNARFGANSEAAPELLDRLLG